MALCKRLIARLDIKGRRLIKGICFEGLRVVGDPREAALRYAMEGADELLYIDAVASLYGRCGLVDLLRRTSREVFIPVTAGGGVRSVEDAANLLAAGADKIAVNTAALQHPGLITELAEAFGSQCVVASIQARRVGQGAWEAMTEAGRERSGRDVMVWIDEVQQLGAGELLLTSVDQDGTCAGPDQALLEAAASKARIPLIYAGGIATTEQLLAAWQHSRLSAVSIGAALHHQYLQLHALKQYLSVAATCPIRPRLSGVATPTAQLLMGSRIGVIDYGMGNQQSLINALDVLGAQTVLSSNTAELAQCNLLALPGVGAFPQGMAALRRRDLIPWLQDWVSRGRPLLGICLGMQMLFEASEEFGDCPGLGWIQGRVVKLPVKDTDSTDLTLPHMGWNQVHPGTAADAFFVNQRVPIYQYFVHSYSATGVDPEIVLFSCYHGNHPFVAAVRQGALAGFQFHPERSGPIGLDLLAGVCQELLR